MARIAIHGCSFAGGCVERTIPRVTELGCIGTRLKKRTSGTGLLSGMHPARLRVVIVNAVTNVPCPD
jgi:hypothetical protein